MRSGSNAFGLKVTADPDFAEGAALLGDRSRAAMLARLLDGRSWTATELARAARIGAPTASAHLTKLRRAGWIAVYAQGRHRYFHLAGPEVASFLEAFSRFAPGARAATPGERRASQQLRRCRLCYDHLAGRIGVEVSARLLERSGPDRSAREQRLGADSLAWLCEIGLAVADLPGKPCMDWSERRLHLAGPLGRALADAFLGAGWLRREPRGRALTITLRGRTGLERHFGIEEPGRLGLPGKGAHPDAARGAD